MLTCQASKVLIGAPYMVWGCTFNPPKISKKCHFSKKQPISRANGATEKNTKDSVSSFLVSRGLVTLAKKKLSRKSKKVT